MDQELSNIKKTVDENNKMLRKLLVYQRYVVWVNILKWLIIIGVSLGLYYIIQPYIEQLMSFYFNAQSIVNPTNSILDIISKNI